MTHDEIRFLYPTYAAKERFVEKDDVKLEPAITGSHSGCGCCGAHPDVFPMDGVIAVGFGEASVRRDGRVILEERDSDDWIYGQHAEDLALADPDHDWRIVLNGPLSGRTYQRHAPGLWHLIEKNQGFA